MAADVIALAAAVAEDLQSIDWGQTATVARKYLDNGYVEKSKTLAVSVLPSGSRGEREARGVFSDEIEVDVCFRKFVGTGQSDAAVDALNALVLQVRDRYRAAPRLAGCPNAACVADAWEVIVYPEELAGVGLYTSVLVLTFREFTEVG